MADIRIKDLANTAASVPADAYEVIDSASGGTEKISRDNKRLDMAAAFVADPATYNLAPLAGGAVAVDKGGTGATTAAGARTNLDVPSNAEVASDITDAIGGVGAKLTGPALYFNGSSSVVTIADDAKQSFVSATDDLPFAISLWVKPKSLAVTSVIVAKATLGANREYSFRINTDGTLRLTLRDNSAASESYSQTDSAVVTVNEWTHVCVTFPGAGPNSANDFSAAADGIIFYKNGVAVASTATNSGSYLGMEDVASTPLLIGGQTALYYSGHLRDVEISNRALTAAEVAQLAKGNDLGFADEWAGAHGGAYSSDFSAGVDGWVVLSNLTLTGNVDSIGVGVNDNLRLVPNTTSGQHAMYKNVLTEGKRFRVSLDYYIPSANSNIDGFRIVLGSAGDISNVTSATTDLWTHYEFEGVCDTGSGLLLIYATDGGATTFQDAGGDDTMYVRNIKVTRIGTLADFRAENYDESTSKLYDESDNAYVGVGTSVTLTGRAYPVYETGTWTPSVTFGGGSTGITYSAQEGYYTRIGNLVHVTCAIVLTSKGTDVGQALVAGLPFTSRNLNGNLHTFGPINMSNAAALTSVPFGSVSDSSTNVVLYDSGASGVATMDDTNFTNTTTLRFSATYQIQ